jgi:hypothetical protein
MELAGHERSKIERGAPTVPWQSSRTVFTMIKPAWAGFGLGKAVPFGDPDKRWPPPNRREPDLSCQIGLLIGFSFAKSCLRSSHSSPRLRLAERISYHSAKRSGKNQ